MKLCQRNSKVPEREGMRPFFRPECKFDPRHPRIDFLGSRFYCCHAKRRLKHKRRRMLNSGHNGFLVRIGNANAVIFVLNGTGYVLRDNGARAHIHNVDSNY